MAAARAQMARDNTMKLTAQEGIAYLKSEGKGDLLKAQKLIQGRDNTMDVTAKEGQALLASMGKVNEDAQTRGQQKQLDIITTEPPAKKSKLARDSTMAATAKEAKGLLGSEKLGDTRQVTKSKKKSSGGPQRQTTIQKCIAESTYFVPAVDMSEGRQTRAQARGDVYKPPARKTNKPAKPGSAKRGRKPKKAAETSDAGDA